MKEDKFEFGYEVYESSDELHSADADLLDRARKVSQLAYAPYSHFRVGAAARMTNGEIVSGTNQENASYPVGICAERVLLGTAATQYPDMAIETMAISYLPQDTVSDHPISPCGMCRQSLAEFESRTKHPVRIILSGQEGKVFIIRSASFLLPLAFSGTEL